MKCFSLADGFMMMGVALLLQRRCVVVNPQTVTDQHTTEVCAEQFANDATSPALSNYIKGALGINETPQPPAWTADPPTCLIAINYRCLAQFFGNGVILALDFGRESIQCLGEPAGAQLQTKTIPQDGAGFSHRKTLGLVQISGQCQGAGSELHTGSAGGQRHLQRMAGTNILTTPGTGALVSRQPCHVRTHQRNVFDKLFDAALINKVSSPAVRTSTEFDLRILIDLIGWMTESAGMSLLASGPLGR